MDDAARYRNNYQEEIDGAAQYRVLADLETDPHLAEVYRKLADTEERHASFWVARLEALDEAVPRARPSLKARLVMWLARRVGPQVLVGVMAASEKAGQTMYDEQPETEGEGMRADERSHARVLSALADEASKGVEGSVLARIEGRHRTVGGNALRAAVLGANDGLVSNLALIMGVAGATFSRDSVLIGGLAGLLAGSASMALGEWLSVQSARELTTRQLEIEAEELEAMPEEEAEELALIYQAKGLPEDRAKELAAHIMQDQETALNTLAREELGIDPDEMGGNPWEAAGTSFFLFAFGAIVPVAPFFFGGGTIAIVWSMALSGMALFVTGAGIALLTGKSIVFSGARQTIFGLAAAGIVFGIGTLLGAAIA
ncbi:VIT family protein [bacterium BMS3Abin02]|nr:VIT family protein [bacterium BMS3Abin02]GBE21176.1 VIT family protein [bacterium BMS3Bbin01]HDH25489.1 rubrerythrin family protein [Actinomycetota bacterium]HDL49354.1 rubrerythrin family protein [Actinomycetota bacterium]